MKINNKRSGHDRRHQKKANPGSRMQGTLPFALQGGLMQEGPSMVVRHGILPLQATPESPAVQGLNLKRILNFLAVLLVPAVLLAIAGAGIALQIPPRYAAKADVMIHMQQPGDAVLRYFTSQTLIIKSPALLASIAASNQLTYESLSKSVSVDFPKGANIMRVQVSDSQPRLALSMLQGILAAYEKAVAPIELDESASHQIVSGPDMIEIPVFPVPSQFAAIGAALGLILSLAVFALAGHLRKQQE